MSRGGLSVFRDVAVLGKVGFGTVEDFCKPLDGLCRSPIGVELYWDVMRTQLNQCRER